MRVSLKKTLATVLSVALVLTTCMCALTVGAAATVVGRIDISDNENVVPGESFEVPATIALNAASEFVEVAYKLNLPEGFTLESVVAEDASVATVSVDANSVISVSARGPVESIALVMTISTTLADFEPFDLGVAQLEYADVSEADLILDITDTGRISLYVEHGASDAYGFDEDNHWNTCVAEGCTEKFNETAHTWVAGEKVDATCTAAGSQTYSCVCGATKTEEIAILEHVAGEAVKENEVLPTCTTKGSYDMVTYCTVGGEELSRETVEVDVTDHTPLEAAKENEVAATCAAAGSYDMVARCAECGEVISSESFVIEALAHEYQYADNSDGTHDATCSVCNELVIDNEAHTFTDGECVCGAKEEVACDHTWEIVEIVSVATATESGKINVKCSECEEAVTKDIAYVDTIKVASTVADYAAEIKLGIMIRNDRLDDCGTNFKAYGYFEHYLTKDQTTKKTYVDKAIDCEIGDKKRPGKEFDYGVKAMQVTEDINTCAVVYSIDDDTWHNGPVTITSVRKYADDILGQSATKESEKKLIVNMLNYAEKMQILKSYNNATEKLATYGLSDADAALIIKDAPEMTDTITDTRDTTKDPYVKKYQLDMADKIMADVYFRTDKYTANQKNLIVRATWTNAKGVEMSQDFGPAAGDNVIAYQNELRTDGTTRENHYYLTFDKLSSYDLRQEVTFIFYDGDKACDSIYIASIEAFVKALTGIPAAEVDVYNAMLNYSTASYEHFV